MISIFVKFLKERIKEYFPYYTNFHLNNHYKRLASKEIRGFKSIKHEKLIFDFIKSSPKVTINCKESEDILRQLRVKSNKIFLNNEDKAIFKVATNNNNKLIQTYSTSKYDQEIYRFVFNPLNYIPEVLDLVLTKSFQDIFESLNFLKFADAHLRLSTPNKFEKHTTGFHRDYNSFSTLKIFIPLTKNNNEDFLEYYSSTLLKSTSELHYRPRHIALNKIVKKYRNKKTDKVGRKDNEFPIINTSCIHREIPSRSEKITLILTFLAHPAYGGFKPSFNLDYDNLKLERFKSSDFLSFVDFQTFKNTEYEY